jgi:ribosome-associated protein
MEELKEKVRNLKEWMAAKKGEDIVEIEVSDKSSFTDYFLICSGKGEVHTKAIANHLINKAKESKIFLMGSEGMTNARWILLDFSDVVVHIFDAPLREYYQLEDLWEKMPVRKND